MTARIHNSTAGAPPPAAPARPDGQPYPYELVAAGWRGYGDSFTDLAELLIDGYGDLAGPARDVARLQYAADAQAPLQAAVTGAEDLASC